MQIQQLNRTDAEKITYSFKNIDGGGSITLGAGVCLAQAGASIDGIGAVNSTAATWEGWIGIARSGVAINDFGKTTAAGYAASILLSHVGTSITITAGDFLKPGAVAGTFFSSLTDQAMSTLLYKYAYAASTTVAISAQTWVDGVVRAF